MTNSLCRQAPTLGSSTERERATGVQPWLGQYPPEFDDYWLEVRGLHGWRINPFSKKGRARTTRRYFQIGKLKRNAAPLDRYVISKAAAGYHVHLVRNPLYCRLRRSSNWCDVARITSFALDLDGLTAEEALRLAGEAGLPTPSLVVFTGHGAHLYFFLATPLSVRLGARYLKEFVLYWSSRPQLVEYADDGVRDPARVLRLQCINYKELPVPPGEDPSLEDWRAFITLEHLARVIEDNGELKYNLDDLLPSLDPIQARDVLARDRQAMEEQDRLHASVGAFAPVPPRSPSPLSKGAGACTRLVSDGEGAKGRTAPQAPLRNNTQREVEGLDLDYIEFLVERVEVTGPKERHKALARLVAKLRKSYDVLSEGQKRLIHSIWYPRWQANMSGLHDEESSLQDFLETWHNLPRDFPGNAEWLDDVLADLHPHPLRALAKTEDERKIADVLWTGRKPDGRCFLSCRVAAKALGKGRDTASRVLNSLVRLGIVELVEKGSKATGHASVYRAVPGGSSGSSTNPDDVAAPTAASEGSDA